MEANENSGERKKASESASERKRGVRELPSQTPPPPIFFLARPALTPPTEGLEKATVFIEGLPDGMKVYIEIGCRINLKQ